MQLQLHQVTTKHSLNSHIMTAKHGQAICGDIWKYTMKKSQTSVTSVTLHPLGQTLWRYIWKHTVEKNRTTATSVSLHPLGQAIWKDIWKRTFHDIWHSMPFDILIWSCLLHSTTSIRYFLKSCALYHHNLDMVLSFAFNQKY